MSRALRFDTASLYAAIGELTVTHQRIDDVLEHVFATALGGSYARAIAIFRVVKGAENQRRLVSAALVDGKADYQTRWQSLVARIDAAGRLRGQIVHSQLVRWGGGLVVDLEHPDTPARSIEEPSWKVAKVRDKRLASMIGVAEIEELTDECDQISRAIASLLDDLRAANASTPPSA
jgi:hypothetical protein